MNMKRRMGRVLVVSALLALVACDERSDRERLAAAQAYIDNRDPSAATLELKNLLQTQPDLGVARWMLGKLLLEAGDATGAEAELQRALAAGHAKEAVLPLLAVALLQQQKTALLLQQCGQEDLADAQAAATLKTQVALAHLAQGAPDAAQTAVDRALQRVPSHPQAQVVRARITGVRGDPAAAMAQVSDVLTRLPDNTEAWVLKADLLAQAGGADLAPAIEAYRQALARQADLVPVHVALLSLLIGQRDFAGATSQWAVMQKALPNRPQTQYFEALLALQRGDAARTREVTQGLLRNSPESLNVLLLATRAELQLNGLEQAEALASKAVQLAPKSALPRQLLAEVLLRSGQLDKAQAALKPLLEGRTPDPQALALAGQAKLMAGDSQAAELLLARAAKLQPDDNRIRTSVAMAALDHDPQAFAALESIAKADSGSTADMALISARVQRKQFDAALKAVDGLAAKLPKQALPDYLRGNIALQQRDKARARKQFEAALAKEGGYFPAIAGLAQLDIADGRPEAARARFEALVQQEPGNAQAYLALADLTGRTGGSRDDVTRLLQDAVQAKPGEAAARAVLIDHHLASGDSQAALEAAQRAVAALPGSMDLLDRLGRTLLVAGDTNQAIVTFKKWAFLRPKSEAPHLRLADAYLHNNNLVAARASAGRALEIDPGSLAALRTSLALALQDQQPAQAMAFARTVQGKQPDAALGFMMEGEVELAQQHVDLAAAAFRKALQKPDSAAAAARLHFTLASGGKADEARQFADGWLQQHPDDLGFRFHLGDMARNGGDLVAAEARYREVLKRLPDNVMALNNVAEVLLRQKKPGAVALAQRAVTLAPNRPALMDTLAMSYAGDNQLDKALDLQRQVVAQSPRSAVFRLNLARLQLQAGDKDGARAELDKLARLGSSFDGQAQVQQLLKDLGT